MSSVCAPILFEVYTSQAWQFFFTCSSNTSLAREINSGQIPFQGGSSQQSGRFTPLQVTHSLTEAFWAFLPTR